MGHHSTSAEHHSALIVHVSTRTEHDSALIVHVSARAEIRSARADQHTECYGTAPDKLRAWHV